MSKSLSTPMLAAAIAVVCLLLAIVGLQVFSGPKQGEKPKLDPVLNRMYGPHPVVPGTGMPANATSSAH